MKQRFEEKNERIRQRFQEWRKQNPQAETSLNLSWSNWGFGIEPLETSIKRLHQAGLSYIELHGNHYGPDLGYRPQEVLKLLKAYEMQVSGICGMYSSDSDFSSNRAIHRQAAIDYTKRTLEFAAAVGAEYMLVVPSAVGRPDKYDDTEFERSVEALGLVADLFTEYGIKGAIEPIRSAEVSLVRTVGDAQRYIAALNHPGIAHINGDVYHMQSEEAHIGEAILEAGDQLVNLHLADSNRGAMGHGSMDVDAIIMSLHLIGFGGERKYATFEPLGPGGAPYPAMYGKPDPQTLDRLVQDSVRYFREREAVLMQSL
ncbi:sugar phosphate isomerase/epimerase family protein [Paenibacillus hodogayensis]|uniref:Sugar phosphate isomerase/epimerase family protein n=1 Tax=Paenibacillus hodogayensis TaxID=279208 RepID=A0ABV5VX96_9BACL